MESLQTLSVELNYRDELKYDGVESSHLVADPLVDCCQRKLKPLLAIRGLQKFTLHSGALVKGYVPETAGSDALIERIREGAVQPRTEHEDPEIG